MSPHPLRRAAITYALNQNYPKEHLTERANVGVDVLDARYDAVKEGEKRKRRDRFFGLLECAASHATRISNDHLADGPGSTPLRENNDIEVPKRYVPVGRQPSPSRNP